MDINLETEDQKQLIRVIKDIPELGSEPSRRQMLELAGLKELATHIDVSGSTFFGTNEIISYLSKLGRLTYENAVLGLFLNTLKEVTGIQQQEFIDKLLNKYNMMTPIATSPNIIQWRGKETPVSVQEKIIGENTLRPIAFLTEGLKVAKSVAYIEINTVDGKISGTGFLVTPSLVLTNNHVLPDSELVKNTLFRFNYEENFQGKAQQVSEYQGKIGGIFHTNEVLDYTLVEIEGELGKECGYLPLASRDIKVDQRVNIIQHPAGQPKKISMQNNFVQYVDKNVVQYITSTMPGSSGSPVFNNNWEVVALHHAGGNIPEPTTGKKYYRNEGIWIGRILQDLPEELKKLLAN